MISFTVSVAGSFKQTSAVSFRLAILVGFLTGIDVNNETASKETRMQSLSIF